MAVQITGNMIGTYGSASLNGTNPPNLELTVSGITPLGTSDDIYYLEVYQNPSDTFTNGQFWRLTDADGNVIMEGLNPDNNNYQNMGAGDEHVLFQNGYILDISGLDGSTMVYTSADEIADPGSGNNDGELQVSEVENAMVICFAAGSVLRTAAGARPIDDIAVGDLVWTADHGLQPVRWVGTSKIDLTRTPDLAPIEILRGALDRHVPRHPVLVSPQHRVLITGYLVQLYAALEEALVPARCLVNGETIRQRSDLIEVTYVHLMFDRHELLDSGGLISESFFPGATAVGVLEESTRDELFRIFPVLRLFGEAAAVPLARPEIRGRAAALFGRAA
ncbi:Hint domain-containing protein [Celeribacter sp. PS-C1]|uniref:Hint domain-containing protein n=1 Tax=Celeribacter sp. PS-C1 TaxID=2820813 RepID=UPI001C686F6E|nr:Hint domain-containing protein [Celeribacter sp. PS-C1]MBW6418407.1 Hint domain-containing protein [Celeribacter sp. PS-C1]